MNRLTRDPLLTVAKAVLLFLMIVLGLGIAGCLLGIPGLLLANEFVPGDIASAFGDAFPAADPWKVTGALILLLVLTIVLLALVFSALRLLKQIVDTVGEGDPFVPANARRLTTMAWLTLAVQVVTLPMGAIGAWMAGFAKSGHVEIDTGVSGNGLFLMLVLFILARVFRQGTAMREELEGTV